MRVWEKIKGDKSINRMIQILKPSQYRIFVIHPLLIRPAAFGVM